MGKDGFSRRELLRLSGGLVVTVAGGSITASLLGGCGDSDSGTPDGGADGPIDTDALDYYLANGCELAGTDSYVAGGVTYTDYYLYCDDYLNLECRDASYVSYYGYNPDSGLYDYYRDVTYPYGHALSCVYTRAE